MPSYMVRDQKALVGDGSFSEVEFVVVLRGIEGVVVGVCEVAEVDGVGAGVAVEAEFGSGEAVDVVVLEEVAGAEQVGAGDLVGVNFFDDAAMSALDSAMPSLMACWMSGEKLGG